MEGAAASATSTAVCGPDRRRPARNDTPAPGPNWTAVQSGADGGRRRRELATRSFRVARSRPCTAHDAHRRTQGAVVDRVPSLLPHCHRPPERCCFGFKPPASAPRSLWPYWHRVPGAASNRESSLAGGSAPRGGAGRWWPSPASWSPTSPGETPAENLRQFLQRGPPRDDRRGRPLRRRRSRPLGCPARRGRRRGRRLGRHPGPGLPGERTASGPCSAGETCSRSA